MKLLRNFALLCVLSIMSKVAVAIPMDYSFEIVWTSGNFTGTDTVFVTLDEVTGVQVVSEDFAPQLAPPGQLVSFNLTVDGVAFSEQDDTRYPTYPLVSLRDGALTWIDYFAVPGAVDSLMIDVNLLTQINTVSATTSSGIGTGIVDATSWAAVPTADAPAPATLSLFGLGLAGLGFSRRKRQTHD
jgi:hypothetical protein